MKIHKLQAENFMKLKAVEIVPKDDGLVVISGRNAQGKSSVMDSMWAALSGAEAAKIVKKPIRDGEKRAQVVLDLGSMIVTRTWTANDKSYLTVENREGATFKSPQSLLDAMVGSISFDPLEFTRMDEKKQREVLLGLVKIDLNLTEWAQKRQDIYDARTMVNRGVAALEGQIKGLPAVPVDTPDMEISLGDVMLEMKKAQERKGDNDRKRQAVKVQELTVANTQQDMDRRKRTIDQMERDIAELINEQGMALKTLGEEIQELRKLEEAVQGLSDPDLSVYEQKVNDAELTNKAVRIEKQRRELLAELKSNIHLSAAHTAEIAALDDAKQKAIESAQFPIPGLSFTETGVTYNGIPFSQCSASEQLRVSMAMAMAGNPKLRVIRIMDGSLLDADNMKIISEMAAAADFQVWLELVDSTGKVGVYIEDGEVHGLQAASA
jgi:DNA repair exonuclease SbcCD ATPase subunit